MEQMGYVIGAEVRDRGLLRYFNEWQFKHPNVNDLIRIMEKESGLELDWYKEYFVFTTKTIDYAIKEVKPNGDKTELTLQRVGLMPMPVDLVITYKDGSQESIYLPLVIMRGEKAQEEGTPTRIHTEKWAWVNLEKTLVIDRNLETIKSIEIDPTKRMADVQPENNKVEF
jgi:aminopeptidase N